MGLRAAELSSISISHPGVAERDSFGKTVESSERLLAALLLLFLSPILLVVAIVTFAVSGRSPLIAHQRVGQHGSDLWVLKFRTMWHSRRNSLGIRELFRIERIADGGGPRLKGPGDTRVRSRFARFCRRHSVDEFPQLLHVVRGQMSLVGPRPVTREELVRIYGPDQAEILRVKPGVAGLWQVSGRNRLTLEQRRERDLECARRRSVSFYLWILARTIPEVLDGGDTW
jgi:lipopolysaccharide/colanic/teichoic acid biosynthesis glycosyltransferase